MSDLEFSDVVCAWQVAPVEAIHPLRSVDVDAYWESGRAQALDAARWIPEGGRVIDFGCGDGRLTVPLIQLGFDVIGVDASPEMLERLWDRVDEVDPRPIGTILSDGMNLSEHHAIEPQDAVVCRAVLIHHNHTDVSRLVEQFSKILKPGGYLIADWPTGAHYVRQNWTDVTTWLPEHRLVVAESVGLEMVEAGTDAHGSPSVWRKL